MQIDGIVITRQDQARALQDVGFLGRFIKPASPSDVAKKFGMPADLAHHHAQKHAALDLVFEVKRDNGKVYYQLAAKTFKHGRELFSATNPVGYLALELRA